VFLDIIHRPVFIYSTQSLKDWILSPPSGGTYSVQLIDITTPYHWAPTPTQDMIYEYKPHTVETICEKQDKH
jgi:hypothetical protein